MLSRYGGLENHCEIEKKAVSGNGQGGIVLWVVPGIGNEHDHNEKEDMLAEWRKYRCLRATGHGKVPNYMALCTTFEGIDPSGGWASEGPLLKEGGNPKRVRRGGGGEMGRDLHSPRKDIKYK